MLTGAAGGTGAGEGVGVATGDGAGTGAVAGAAGGVVITVEEWLVATMVQAFWTSMRYPMPGLNEPAATKVWSEGS